MLVGGTYRYMLVGGTLWGFYGLPWGQDEIAKADQGENCIGLTCQSRPVNSSEKTSDLNFLGREHIFSTRQGLSLQLIHGDIRHIFLILTWLGVVLLCMGIASTTGLIQIVCNNSVEDEKVRSFGVGLAQGINNFFGNCFGPLLPQMAPWKPWKWRWDGARLSSMTFGGSSPIFPMGYGKYHVEYM